MPEVIILLPTEQVVGVGDVDGHQLLSVLDELSGFSGKIRNLFGLPEELGDQVGLVIPPALPVVFVVVPAAITQRFIN